MSISYGRKEEITFERHGKAVFVECTRDKKLMMAMDVPIGLLQQFVVHLDTLLANVEKERQLTMERFENEMRLKTIQSWKPKG